jgi:hypothetical protein
MRRSSRVVRADPRMWSRCLLSAWVEPGFRWRVGSEPAESAAGKLKARLKDLAGLPPGDKTPHGKGVPVSLIPYPKAGSPHRTPRG